MSDSVRPHRRQPTRSPRPWNSPGKNTGVGCHFLLQCMKVKVAQSCLILHDPMDCSPPGSSVHGIPQPRILEWVASPFSRGSSLTRGPTRVSHIAGRFFSIWGIREALQDDSERIKYQNVWGADKTISRDFIAVNVLLKDKYLKECSSTFNLSWKKRAKVQK